MIAAPLRIIVPVQRDSRAARSQDGQLCLLAGDTFLQQEGWGRLLKMLVSLV
jgi:hypothetical protein